MYFPKKIILKKKKKLRNIFCYENQIFLTSIFKNIYVKVRSESSENNLRCGVKFFLNYHLRAVYVCDIIRQHMHGF